MLKVTKCEPTIPSFSLHLHGGARCVVYIIALNTQHCICSWLYKIFNSKIEKSLKKKLLSLLCKKADDVDKKWNAKISTYPCKCIKDMLSA